MFTGIIEETGRIASVEIRGKGRHFTVLCKRVLDDIKPEDSLAVNGVCLTVTAITEKTVKLAAVPETIKKTNLGKLTAGASVNLERALPMGGRLGGHLVQGHVDDVVTVRSVYSQGESRIMEFVVPAGLSPYIIDKGSVALNGVSLTVAEKTGHTIRIAVIPYTWENTILRELKIGDSVNLEVDLISKYVESILKGQKQYGLTEDKLKKLGY